jgi:hypothetical protein
MTPYAQPRLQNQSVSIESADDKYANFDRSVFASQI